MGRRSPPSAQRGISPTVALDYTPLLHQRGEGGRHRWTRRAGWSLSVLVVAACGGGGTVKGRVTLEGAADSSGVLVTLTGAETRTLQTTGANGAWEFDGVGDGDYGLSFEAADTAEGRRVLAVQMEKGATLEVAPITMTAVGTVSGVARMGDGSDHSGILVAVAGTDATAITGPDGAYVLRNAPAGARKLVASHEGWATRTVDLAVNRGATPAPELVLERALPPPGRVTGTVGFFSGTDPTSIRVKVKGLAGVEAAPDATGRYTLSLPAGTYELVAVAPTYPTLSLGLVTVGPGGTVEQPLAQLSAYHRLKPLGPANRTASALLLEDGRHLLVKRDYPVTTTETGHTFSTYDLETGHEHPFFATTSDAYQLSSFVQGRTGKVFAHRVGFVAWVLFDTGTGERRYVTGEITNSTPIGLSSDEAHFFTRNGTFAYRISVADGQLAPPVPANLGFLEVDRDHSLALDVPSGTTTANVTLLTHTGQTPVLSAVAPSSFQRIGKRLVALTDCTGTTNCTLRVVDGVTGQVRSAPGAFSTSTTFSPTDHASWVRVTDGSSRYLRLDDATLTPFPAGFTAAVASAARINEAGTRIAFVRQEAATTHRFYLAPMPPQTLPAELVTSTAPIPFGWVSASRVVAYDDGATKRLVDVRNDTPSTLTDVSEFFGVWPTTAVWKRWSDRVLLAFQGDAADPVVLGSPAEDFSGPVAVYGAGNTPDGAWTVWSVTEWPYTVRMVARQAFTGTVRVRRDVYPIVDPDLITNQSVLMGLSTGEAVYYAYDLASGVERLLAEPDLLPLDYPYTLGGQPYVRAVYAVGAEPGTTAPITMPAIALH